MTASESKLGSSHEISNSTSFMMENMYFNNECRQRVKDILTNRITVSDALAELNKKYGVSENQNES